MTSTNRAAKVDDCAGICDRAAAAKNPLLPDVRRDDGGVVDLDDVDVRWKGPAGLTGGALLFVVSAW
jgi:hypothetical protein